MLQVSNILLLLSIAPRPVVVVEVPDPPHFAGEQLMLTCRFSLPSSVDEGVTYEAEWSSPDGLTTSTAVITDPTSPEGQFYSVLPVDLNDTLAQTGVYVCNVSVISTSSYIVGSYGIGSGLVSVSGEFATISPNMYDYSILGYV